MSARALIRSLAIALGVAVATAQSARADKIDPALMDQSQKLLHYIKGKTKGAPTTKPYTVGVLKFRAKKDGGGETFNAGPINSKMAERLEMTLIMALAYELRPKPPIQIIHDASSTVVAQKQGLGYLTADHRAKLFALDYPLAVGSDKVKPDLFLTGTVHIDTKTRKTSVTIQGFGRNATGFEEVAKFDVDTDRSTLSDMGMGFALAKRGFNKLPDPDAAALDNAVAGSTSPLPLATENPVDLKMFINGREVGTDYDMNNSTTKLRLLQKPEPGDRIHFTLANKTNDARYAAVLKVNGLSTLFEDTNEAALCRKFILKPNAEPIVVDGFYLEESGKGNKVPFKVNAEEPVGEPMKNEELGIVSLHVFAESEGATIPASESMTRGLSPRKWSFENQKATTYNQLASSLKGRKPDTRNFILPGKEREDGNKLVTEPFNNPSQICHIQIRYFDKEAPARD